MIRSRAFTRRAGALVCLSIAWLVVQSPGSFAATRTKTATTVVAGQAFSFDKNGHIVDGPARAKAYKVALDQTSTSGGTILARASAPRVTLSSTGTNSPRFARATAAAVGSYACDASSTPKNLTVYANKYLTISSSRIYAQYLLKRYKYAHSYNAGGFSWDQYEMCEVGGGQSANRLLTVGAASTDRVSAARISGWKWKDGCNLGSLSATLSINAVYVTGSVTQSANTDCNYGAQGYAPDPITSNNYPQNEVTAWWATGCSGYSWCGSTGYQGSNPLGRWDFHNGNLSAQDFYWDLYVNYT
jgi:hypothetical protein